MAVMTPVVRRRLTPQVARAGGSAVRGSAEGAKGTYPAEKPDLGGGTSDGDTPSGSTGG